MSHYSKGFSVVEVMVSLAIVAVILTVIVFNQSSYTDGAALGNLADEIGLSISQAQAYGIAVREFTPGSSDFSAAYGLTLSLLSGGSDSAYLFFADRNANSSYDGDWTCPVGGASECLERVDMKQGNRLDELCVVKTNGADQCNVGRIDITFVRPNTEARLIFFNNDGQSYNPPNMKGARIMLKSPKGVSRSVVIYTSGQISVQ